MTNGIPLGCSLVLPVDTANCVQTLKVLSNDAGVLSGLVTHTISQKSVVVTDHTDSVDSRYTTIVVQLHKEDMDLIKNKPSLAVDEDSTHLSFAVGTFTDIDGNNVEAIALANAKQCVANGYTVDVTSPELTTFAFNMNSKTMTLNFDEPVDDAVVGLSAITIQSSLTGGTVKQLTGGSKSRSLDGMVITITLLDADINAQTKNEGLAVDDLTTNIVIGSTLIKDMAGVTVQPILSGNARNTELYTPDTTRPELQTFDLNMDTGVLTLHFLETMDISDLAVDQMTLQTSANAADSSTAVVLSTSEVGVTDEDGLTVFIYLTDEELDELKIKNIGRTQGSTYLVMTAATIRDMAEQQVEPLENNANAMQTDAATFVADSTDPIVESFDVDLDTNYGTITLKLSETIRATSFEAQTLMFVSEKFNDYTCPCSSCFPNEFETQEYAARSLLGGLVWRPAFFLYTRKMELIARTALA
jgi:hypothetical protein